MKTAERRCCICLQFINKMEPLSNRHSDRITYYKKLITCVPQMRTKITMKTLICEKCQWLLKFAYSFWKQCTRPNTDSEPNISPGSSILDTLQKDTLHLSSVSTFTKSLPKITCGCRNSENRELSMEDSYVHPVRRSNSVTFEKKCSEININPTDIKETLVELNGVNEKEFKVLLLTQNKESIQVEEIRNTDLFKKVTEKKTVEMESKFAQTEEAIQDVKTDDDLIITNESTHLLKQNFLRISQSLIFPQEPVTPTSSKEPQNSINKQSFLIKPTNIPESKPKMINILECDICEKKFLLPNKLQEHRETHIDKPYLCQHCKKTYRNKSDLVHHMRIHDKEEREKLEKKPHSGERIHMAYSCRYCGKMYEKRIDLIYHLEKHKREDREKENKARYPVGRLLKCFICNKKFTSPIYLREHKAKHNQCSSYQCTSCKQIFRTNLELRIHKIRHKH